MPTTVTVLALAKSSGVSVPFLFVQPAYTSSGQRSYMDAMTGRLMGATAPATVWIPGPFSYPVGMPVTVTVLDQDGDPPALARSYPDPIGSGMKTEYVTDNTRIGRLTYQCLLADQRFQVT